MASFLRRQSNSTTTWATPISPGNSWHPQSENETALWRTKVRFRGPLSSDKITLDAFSLCSQGAKADGDSRVARAKSGWRLPSAKWGSPEPDRGGEHPRCRTPPSPGLDRSADRRRFEADDP